MSGSARVQLRTDVAPRLADDPALDQAVQQLIEVDWTNPARHLNEGHVPRIAVDVGWKDAAPVREVDLRALGLRHGMLLAGREHRDEADGAIGGMTMRRSTRVIGRPLLRHGFRGSMTYSLAVKAFVQLAAIDVQDVACDHRGVGQVQDRVRNVLNRRWPTHWRQGLHQLVRSLSVHRGEDDTGRDGVYTDAVVRVRGLHCGSLAMRRRISGASRRNRT